MTDKKYQIFISSTYVDLQVERLALMDCVINYGHIPVGMELFNAADETQWNIIKKYIDDSDYYILILSDRYGSTDEDGFGYIEKEYDYAIKSGKPVISFVRDNNSIEKLPPEYRETENRERLRKFKEKVSRKLFKPWKDSEDLSRKFLFSFSELLKSRPQPGWIRGINIKKEINDFFYNLDEKPETNFSFLIKNATKVHVLARTAVNLLGQYERDIIDLIKKDCDVKLIFVGPESDAVKYIYGTDPHVYFDNARKMKSHLLSIKSKTGKIIQVKTTKHAPTMSIIHIEKEDGESFVIVQFYFLYSKIGRDRPTFRLNKDDRWYNTFKDEFDKIWENADDWNTDISL